MPLTTLKTALINLGIVLFSVCITIITLPYIIYDLIFGDNRI